MKKDKDKFMQIYNSILGKANQLDTYGTCTQINLKSGKKTRHTSSSDSSALPENWG